MIVSSYLEQKENMLLLGKQHKVRLLDMISLRNDASRSYMTWLPMTLSDLDMILNNLHLDDVPGADSKIHCTLSADQERDIGLN